MRSWIMGALALFLLAPLAQADNISWPQEIEADSGAVVLVYQPQIEEFSGNDIVGRAAISVKNPESDNVPVFGAIWFEAKIDADRDARTATIRDVDILDVRFAEASDEQKEALADLIESQVEGSQFTISVDQLLADLDAEKAGVAEAELKHNPPKIMLSTKPALLVSIDGDPVFEMIDGSRYERVVNTPFLLVRGGTDYYLYIGSNAWYASTSISGAWTRTKRVPDDVASLVEPADDDDTQVDDIQIIIANEPTELIVSDGPPSWAPVEGMNLLYMDNTDSNAFLELSTQSYYVLLSGRWYRGEGLLGDLQWSHVPNNELPEPFGDIRFRKQPLSSATTTHSASSTTVPRPLRRSKRSTSCMHKTPVPPYFATGIFITLATTASGMSPTCRPDHGLLPPTFLMPSTEFPRQTRITTLRM